MRRRSILIGLSVCVAVLLIGYLIFIRSHNDASGGQPAKTDMPIVQVAAVSVTDVPLQIASIGHVEPIAFVAVRPRIDGVIAEVLVQDGQHVKAGEVLFKLDDREEKAAVQIAEANLQRDQAQLENARQEVERIRPLLKKNYATTQQMDQLLANMATQQAMVEAAKAQVEEQKLTLSYTIIAAPIEGRLGTIRYKTGNVVRANDAEPLVMINQLQPIYVGFTVTQQDIPALQQAMTTGSPPKVEINIPGNTIALPAGQVRYIDNNINVATNSLSVKAEFANQDETLWPGQFVNISMTLKTESNVLTIPLKALQNGQNGSFVWVVLDDQSVEMRNLQIARTTNELAIVTQGLKVGEQIVVEGQLRLKQGIKVKIMPVAVNAVNADPLKL